MEESVKIVKPLVTVIIPTYNRAVYLKIAIESVLAQTYSNFELLVLDDFSSDNTAEIVANFNDPRIRYIRHRCRLGLVANWTYGVRWAEGAYFAILGDDDRYKPEFLSRRIEALSLMSGVIAVAGSFECCDTEGRIIARSLCPSETSARFEGMELIRFTLSRPGQWFNGATLYRKDVVLPLWNTIAMAGTALDFSMHIRLSLIEGASVAFVNDRNMILCVHEGQESISNNIFLAQSGAQLALHIWEFERPIRKEYRTLFGRRFSKDINHYARMLWDRGNVAGARNLFKKELFFYPYSWMTWLRFLRTFILRPTAIKQ